MSQCGKEEACANAENCGACSRRYDDRFLDKNSFKIQSNDVKMQQMSADVDTLIDSTPKIQKATDLAYKNNTDISSMLKDPEVFSGIKTEI